MIGGYRIEIVPDNDADANQRIPKDVLASLPQGECLMGLAMMYVRQSTWEKLEPNFNRRTTCLCRS
jgi:hypothetical protein